MMSSLAWPLIVLGFVLGIAADERPISPEAECCH
jgi:hypothetical protein